MSTAAITILGLGPGSIDDLTRQAFRLLQEAEQQGRTVYFRTIIHPTIKPLQQELPTLKIESFDRLYDESDDWQSLYQQISTQVCTQATQQPLIYAVPGHPLLGEISVQLILRQAREQGLSTTIVGGLSFLEPVCTLLELDPCEAGTQIVDATSLAAIGPEEIAGKVIPTVPLLVAQVYNRRLASAVKLALSECYPDEWLVKLVRAAGVHGEETIVEIPLYQLDRESYANHLSTLYVPPVDELTALRIPETLRYIIMRLRRDPDGCPWDRQQTHESLKRYVIEETYEVVEALEENDMHKLAEELGDLLLQVYLHAEIARQSSEFTLSDIYEQINAKMIRRHPHIFGTIEANSSEQVIVNWEAIKQQERAASGADIQAESVLDRVPQEQPALMVANEYQKRARKTGFAFFSIDEVYAKIDEEFNEIKEASTPAEQLEELGDLLFMVAEIGQTLKIDPEEALRLGNRKFRRRFQGMEEIARGEGRELSSYTLPEWRALWARSKANLAAQ